jgi:hypothetical protein
VVTSAGGGAWDAKNVSQGPWRFVTDCICYSTGSDAAATAGATQRGSSAYRLAESVPRVADIFVQVPVIVYLAEPSLIIGAVSWATAAAQSASGGATCEILEKKRFDAIISDMGRKEGPREGYVLLEALRAQGDQTPSTKEPFDAFYHRVGILTTPPSPVSPVPKAALRRRSGPACDRPLLRLRARRAGGRPGASSSAWR